MAALYSANRKSCSTLSILLEANRNKGLIRVVHFSLLSTWVSTIKLEGEFPQNKKQGPNYLIEYYTNRQFIFIQEPVR